MQNREELQKPNPPGQSDPPWPGVRSRNSALELCRSRARDQRFDERLAFALSHDGAERFVDFGSRFLLHPGNELVDREPAWGDLGGVFLFRAAAIFERPYFSISLRPHY